MKPSLPETIYDRIADSYAKLVPTKPHNAYYDRPAVLSLLPENLQGLRVLDAGCGTGAYSGILVERGAQVIGVDANENMLRHARAALGAKADFVLANLEEPLTFLEDQSVDGVISPLTLAYIEDLALPLTEFARVLKPGGWLVFSTEHPFFAYSAFQVADYYKNQRVNCVWKGFGEAVEMPSFYHNLGSIFDCLFRAGFLVERLLEAKATEEFKAADPIGFEKIERFPLFVTVRALRRPLSGAPL